jgi:hypothetical protein
MIKRSTWVLLLILLLILVAYFLINNRSQAIPADDTPTAQIIKYLITSEDGILQSLRITDHENASFAMMRNTNNEWVVTYPLTQVADQGLAEAAVTQLSSLRIITTLEEQFSLSEAGFDDPAYTMDLEFPEGIKHQIKVGMLTPINSGYYVRFDNLKTYVVSSAGIDSLANLISSPPIPPTSTPEPTPSPTPTLTGVVSTATP